MKPNVSEITDHPAASRISRFFCGFKGCNCAASGVFEVRDGNEVVDVPLCEKHASELAN
jgi:hypothetical protein